VSAIREQEPDFSRSVGPVEPEPPAVAHDIARTLLAAVLVNPSLASAVIAAISLADLGEPVDRVVYQSIVRLQRADVPPSYLAVDHDLERRRELDGIRVDFAGYIDGRPHTDDLGGYLRLWDENATTRWAWRRLEATREDLAGYPGESDRVIRELIADLSTHKARRDLARGECRLYRLDEMADRPAIEFFAGTRFARERAQILYGQSGTGKSLLAEGWAMAIAQTEPVVYCALEGQAGIRTRGLALAQHRRWSIDRFYVWPEPLNLLDRASVDLLAAAIRARTDYVACIIVDTYSKSIPGANQNDPALAELAAHNFSLLQREFKSAGVLVHHTNATGQRERGTNAPRGGADIVLEVQRTDDLVRVICSKSRDSEEWPDDYFRPVKVGDSIVLEPADRVRDDTVKPVDLKFLESVLGFGDEGATIAQICRDSGLDRATAYRCRGRLKSVSCVRETGRSGRYTITDAGRAIVSRQAKPTSINDSNDIENKVSVSHGSLTAVSETSRKSLTHVHTLCSVKRETETPAGGDRPEGRAGRPESGTSDRSGTNSGAVPLTNCQRLKRKRLKT
jgi:AAA domain